MNFSSYIKMDYEQVRKIQEAAEAAGSDFWESVEADPNFDYDDWVVKHAEQFRMDCSPLELSELGPGVRRAD